MNWLVVVLALSIWDVCEVRSQSRPGFWDVPVIEEVIEPQPESHPEVRPQPTQRQTIRPVRRPFFRRHRR